VFTVVRIFFLVASLCNSVSGLLLQIPSSVSVRYVYQSVLPLVTIVSSREMAYSIELPFGGSGSGGGSSESCAHWPAPPGTYGWTTVRGDYKLISLQQVPKKLLRDFRLIFYSGAVYLQLIYLFLADIVVVMISNHLRLVSEYGVAVFGIDTGRRCAISWFHYSTACVPSYHFCFCSFSSSSYSPCSACSCSVESKPLFKLFLESYIALHGNTECKAWLDLLEAGRLIKWNRKS